MACTTQKRIVLPPVCMPPGCPPPCCPSPCCPPKCCPPPCCPPPCCPPPCCPSPCCPPPYCPSPCCPPPCCPQPCCPPPCYPGCFPCMPACPPSCCPPPCPKPCCGPKAPCCPKPPCCPCPPACCRPVNLCNCCGGKSTIVCVPKGCPPSCCCGPCGPQCCSPCCPPSCGPPAAEDKPASFNNCNFYCSDLPKGLRGGPSNNLNDCYADPCCGGEDECCYDGMNRAAGDDQLAPIPRSGRTSSTSSRHGGSGTNHANGNRQHNHLKNQRGTKKNRSGYVEEEYEEYVSPPRSSSSPSKRSGSSSGNYSYSKSTKSSDPSKQKALKVANVSKNKEKGSEASHKLLQSRNHKHISAQGTRYTTFADQLHSPKGVSFARGDVRTKRNEPGPDCPKDPTQRTKIKLEDIVFPVRNLTRKSTTEKTIVVSPDIQACVAQPAGDQQCVQNEATKSKESSSKDQTSPVLSSQFSTHKIFVMGKLLDGVSSSTISAPPTKYTPVNNSASNHSILTPHHNSKSNSFLRHSKSLEIFKQNEPADLELIKQSGHLQGKGEIRALLKTAALEHMKAPPLQVMTCLIERARLEDSKRFVVMLQPGFKRQTTADDLTSAPSNITGCASARKALPSGFESQEIFKSSNTEKSQSNGTMQSFCSSGMVAHPPSARLRFPFNNPTPDGILHEVKSIRTVTLPLIQQASRHEQITCAIEKDTAFPTQKLPLLQHIFHSDDSKPILISPTKFPPIQPQLGFAVKTEGENGKSDSAEVSTGVSVPPLAHINCVGKTHGESRKVEFEKAACPLLRRKRKARRVLMSNNGFWSGDGAQTFSNYSVKS